MFRKLGENMKNRNNLRWVRRDRDITQERLAELIQTNKSYICELERGNIKSPSLARARLIALQLNSSVDEIFPE